MVNVFLVRPTGKFLVCVAWRFCRAGCTSGAAAGREIRPEARENEREARENERRRARERAAKMREKVAPGPISSRFLCPRPPLLLSAPNQNRYATQARKFPGQTEILKR